MPNSDRVPRCAGCGERVDWLPYTKKDGTVTRLCVDPVAVNRLTDPMARTYVMYEAPDGEDRARLVTNEEPFDESTEFRIRLHLLTCRRRPDPTAKRPSRRRRTPARSRT
jgi:hypothetical protein